MIEYHRICQIARIILEFFRNFFRFRLSGKPIRVVVQLREGVEHATVLKAGEGVQLQAVDPLKNTLFDVGIRLFQLPQQEFDLLPLAADHAVPRRLPFLREPAGALEELQENVHYYYRNRRSAAFCQMAAETIDELKSAGLSGQQLADLAKGCGAESGKLGELALIFQGYETLLAGTGMDPSDRLELAGTRLEEALARHSLPEFLRDRAVFIDEFDTFNAPKKRLMGAMLAALPTVTVALCDDGAPMVPGDMGLFSGAKQVAAQLRQLARKNGADAAVPELLRRDLTSERNDLNVEGGEKQ